MLQLWHLLLYQLLLLTLQLRKNYKNDDVNVSLVYYYHVVVVMTIITTIIICLL